MPGSLSGVRIIDLSAQYSGPIGTGMLADQGADVVKIEPIIGGDGTRYTQPSRGLSAMFAAINRNKRSLALDIRAPEGKEILRDLLRDADVLVQNFRPGVMDRLGFSYEQVRAINPKVIYVSINGFGSTGPSAHRRAYDSIVQTEVAMPVMQANPETGEPEMVRQGIVDKLTALVVAQATVSALYARTNDPKGHGQHVEVPMIDAALWFVWPDGMYNHILLGGNIPKEPEVVEHLRLRKTKNGHLMVQIVGQEEYNGMCRALGRLDLINDPRFGTPEERYKHLRELNQVFAPLFEPLDTDDIYTRLMEEDVPVAKVRPREAIFDDPQIQARSVVEVVKDVTGGDMRRVKHPINFSVTGEDRKMPAPYLGQHSAEILREIKYSDSRIDELAKAKVIACAK